MNSGAWYLDILNLQFTCVNIWFFAEFSCHNNSQAKVGNVLEHLLGKFINLD
jgi:hypothetical protein